MASNQDRGSAVRMEGAVSAELEVVAPLPPVTRKSPDPFASGGREGNKALSVQSPRAEPGEEETGSREHRPAVTAPGRPKPRRLAGWLGEQSAQQLPALECFWKTPREARRHCTCVILKVPGIRPAAGRVSKRLLKMGALKMPLALPLLCISGARVCVRTRTRTGHTCRGDHI